MTREQVASEGTRAEGKEDGLSLDRAKKEQVVAELHDKLERASAAILTDFKGMTVEEITALRNALAQENVEYRVVKNTLMKLASRESLLSLSYSSLYS